MAIQNKLSTYVSKIHRAPRVLQGLLLTKLFCSQVKFANTAGVEILAVSDAEVRMRLTNKRRVQNHIGGVHAVAAALLAESATGLLLGMHVSDRCLPLLKSMTLSYQRRMQGNIHACASLSAQQIADIRQQEKGELLIPVSISDDSGQQPIECEMCWAWVPKRTS